MQFSISSRVKVLIAAIIINLCLGSIYAWSIFAAQLKVEHPDWTMTAISNIFSLMVFTYALTTIIAGMLQDRIGPRKVASLGGIFMGMGIIFSGRADSLNEMYIWHGLVAGIGVGFAYVTPIATILKWFPEQRGLMIGLVMGFFGAGAMVFGPIAGLTISWTGSVYPALTVLGWVYLILITLSAQFLKNPPIKGHSSSPVVAAENLPRRLDYNPRQMLRQGVFYITLIVFLLGCVSGLTLLSNAQRVGEVFAGLSAAAAITTVGIISVFNALGGPAFGMLCDRIGSRITLFILFLLYSIALFLLPYAHFFVTFVFLASLVTLCYGGLFAVFPTIIADHFGTQYLGANYGLLFIAFGIAAILGPYAASSLVDGAQSSIKCITDNSEAMNYALIKGFTRAFQLAGTCALIGTALSLFIINPQQKKNKTV